MTAIIYDFAIEKMARELNSVKKTYNMLGIEKKPYSNPSAWWCNVCKAHHFASSCWRDYQEMSEDLASIDEELDSLDAIEFDIEDLDYDY